jgi:prolyl-tRNA synthetase
MKFTVAGADGKPVTPEMGSYGIGVSRMVGAVIEASHDEAGIIWPENLAPFPAVILNLRVNDATCDAVCEKAYAAFNGAALLDDRDERAGAKFADADLMGHPWQIIVGPRAAANGRVELKRRKDGAREEVTLEAALQQIRK